MLKFDWEANRDRASELSFRKDLGEQVRPPLSFALIGECLKQWANEVHDMGAIIWKTLFVKLPAVETKNK